LYILGRMRSLLQPLPGINDQRIGVKATDPIVQSMRPVKKMLFNLSNPRLAHTRMARNRRHIIVRLSYDLVDMRGSIKIVGTKLAGVHVAPLYSLSVFHSKIRCPRSGLNAIVERYRKQLTPVEYINMILDALIAQFQQRFQHEKRARVCLWFDDKGEFAPLLPAFREHLSAIQPSPFVLLEYDPDAYHMKGYMEDGAFSRGRDMITAEGSIVFVGNLDGTVETIVRTSHLFYPMPKEMDTAFYDRIHAYIPGWEFQKTHDDLYANHFGLVTDYMAEVFRELRKRSYVDYVERAFRFGSHLGGRDQKAVRKIVSGLIKLLHPDGEVTKEEMEEYLTYAIEMRRRVKEQLKKMGGLEYWDTSFSYIDRDSGQETFVPVPEMGGGSLIIEGSLAPGGVYTIGTDVTNNRLALFLLQAQMNPGSGRIIPLGNLSNRMKEAIKTADAYLKANVWNLGIDRDLKGYDFSVQAINLNQAKEGAETAVAFFISMVSAILDKPVLDHTVVLGEMSVQGLLLKVNALPERMQLAVEAGARRILIPSENKRDLADVPDAIRTAIQWQFYDSPTKAAIIAMGMN
jgi:hypothetical protein